MRKSEREVGYVLETDAGGLENQEFRDRPEQQLSGSMVDLPPRPDTPALLLTSSRPTAGCLPWSQESQWHAALMCGWPLQSAAAMPGEAGSAGSHLARPAVE